MQILKMLKEKRKPGGKHNHRLFLKPLPTASQHSAIIWHDTPIGKNTVSENVSFYVKQLFVTKHPLFLDCPHFTNS